MANTRGNYWSRRKVLNRKRFHRRHGGESSPVVKYSTLQWSKEHGSIARGTIASHSEHDSGGHVVRDSVRRADLRQRAKCGLRWAPERSSAPVWNGHLARVGLAYPLSPSGGPRGDAAGLVRVSEDRPPWRREFSDS